MANNAVCNSRNTHLNLFNRINSLPDFILAEILSFLPTKEAVATSILSKRWEFVWTMAHNLDFTFDASVKEDKDQDFVEYVNNVLLLNDVRSLNKFRFSCISQSHHVSTYASSWTNNAIRRNVHHLYLHLETLAGQSQVLLDIFSCASLRSLELDVVVTFSTAIQVFLPNIEILKLSFIQFETEEAFEKLIRGCPILSHIYLCSWFKHKKRFTYVISSTSLTTLEVVSKRFCSIKLEASSLEYLKIDGLIRTFFVVKSLSSLIEVDLSGIKLSIKEFSKANISNSKIVESVHAFDCTKALTLSFNVMKALRFGLINLSTEFKKLVKFEAKVHCCDWSLLQDFIQCSDNLELLTISNRGVKCDDCERLKWTIPTEVPKCLSNTLKKVVSDGHHSSTEYQREMLRYMLIHGSVLEVMNISFSRFINSSMFEWFQEMSEYSRKSPFCEIIVNGWTSKGKDKVCCTIQPVTGRTASNN